MLFNKGNYVHETGFEISVSEDGKVMLSPNHPTSLRLSEFFDAEKWIDMDTENDDNENEENTDNESEVTE